MACDSIVSVRVGHLWPIVSICTVYKGSISRLLASRHKACTKRLAEAMFDLARPGFLTLVVCYTCVCETSRVWVVSVERYAFKLLYHQSAFAVLSQACIHVYVCVLLQAASVYHAVNALDVACTLLSLCSVSLVGLGMWCCATHDMKCKPLAWGFCRRVWQFVSVKLSHSSICKVVASQLVTDPVDAEFCDCVSRCTLTVQISPQKCTAVQLAGQWNSNRV